MKSVSLAKFEEGTINEDAAIAKKNVIAVSDGAGGGGVFAERWSDYLVNHLSDTPINTYESFDKWIDGIWESFYNECEVEAKKIGGLFLNKFYDEGSFATLAAVWVNGTWICYGDSVAFCYNQKTKELQHSFTRLVDYNNPPFLINCKDPLNENGYRSGQFIINGDSVVFVTSDTLAHYILMMYEVAHKDIFAGELEEAINAQTKNGNFIKSALGMKKVNFEKDVLSKLISGVKNAGNFRRFLEGLRKKGLIGHDDYSIAMM